MCVTIGNKAQNQGNFFKFSGVIFAIIYSNPRIAKLFQLAIKGCGMWGKWLSPVYANDAIVLWPTRSGINGLFHRNTHFCDWQAEIDAVKASGRDRWLLALRFLPILSPVTVVLHPECFAKHWLFLAVAFVRSYSLPF
jgi:hypothetical protein